VITDLSLISPILLISTPSIKIVPYSNSNIRGIESILDVLPEPVLPTIPTFIPGSILQPTPFKTSSVFGLYLNEA
jgi:hypothetical protein